MGKERACNPCRSFCQDQQDRTDKPVAEHGILHWKIDVVSARLVCKKAQRPPTGCTKSVSGKDSKHRIHEEMSELEEFVVLFAKSA